MLLSNLLSQINVTQEYQPKDMEIEGVSYHSKEVSNNHLFVCVVGYKVDGHQFLSNAVENGAVAAIVEKVDPTINIPQYVVRDSRIALAQLGASFYDNPSEKMTVIGVTATSGKTTTTYMIDAIFKEHGYRTGLIGSVQLKVGDDVYPAELTTPESLDLQKLFHYMNQKNTTHVMMEVSSAALELHRVHNVNFDIVSLNNIHREHIDMHGSFEKYIEAKSKLIKEASPDSIAILNLDNVYAEKLVHETKAHPITFSIQGKDGDVTVDDIKITTKSTKFTVNINNEIKYKNVTISPNKFNIELAILGIHNVSNATVAIITSLLNNVTIHIIQQSLKEFRGVERRFDLIYDEGPRIIDDHCSNPGNIHATFKTLEAMNYDDLKIIYAIRGQRGEIVNREGAEAIAEWASKLNIKEVVVTKSIHHVTERDVVTESETQSVLDAINKQQIDVKLIEDLSEAINYGMKETKRGDVILLAGSQGMDHGAEIALEIINTKYKLPH